MKLYANLHTHSTHSDGGFTPRELVMAAHAEGYGAIAVTDHDAVTAYPEVAAVAAEMGMETVLGAEFSVLVPKNYHILGFNFDPEYPEMKEYLEKMGDRATDNTYHCFLEAVENGGISGITWDEVLDYNRGVIWLCNNHVYRAMMAKGLARKEQYMHWFDANFSKQRAKYPPKHDFYTLPELVSLIKRAGGFALVAHPHDQLDDMDYLIECGIEGLEVHHPLLTPEERERAFRIAIERGLFIAGGSDHSGLCGANYDSFESEAEMMASKHYIPPLSAGTEKEFFNEIKMGKINDKYRKSLT